MTELLNDLYCVFILGIILFGMIIYWFLMDSIINNYTRKKEEKMRKTLPWYNNYCELLEKQKEFLNQLNVSNKELGVKKEKYRKIEEEFKFAPNDKMEDYKQDLQNKKEEIYSIITKVKCLRKEIETLDNQIKAVKEGNKESF